MAKEQGLSLNPTKISGTCSRLMCCLKYEQESYEDLIRTTPKVNAYVSTPSGNGFVEEVNLITGKLKVKPENSDGASFIIHKSEVSIIKDGEANKLSKDEIRALKGLE